MTSEFVENPNEYLQKPGHDEDEGISLKFGIFSEKAKALHNN